MLKDLKDFLERKNRDFRLTENDQAPAESTDGGVETESIRWSHTLHQDKKVEDTMMFHA